MSRVIQFSRLSLLVRNHLTENQKRYLLYACGMLFLGFLVFLVLFLRSHYYAQYYDLVEGEISNPEHTTRWEQNQAILYCGGLLVFGGVFACISFVNFSNAAEAIFYMNKPASQFEKWLTEVIVRVFLFFIVYTFLFYVVDIPFTLIVRNLETQNFINSIKDKDQLFHPSRIFLLVNILPKEDWKLICGVVLSAYLSIVGFFMYGAVLYSRFSFFKTLLLGFVVGMLYFLFILLVVKNSVLLPEGWRYNFPGGATKYDYQEVNLIAELSDSVLELLVYAVLIFVPVVLLICSYLKLKEKEV